MQKIESTLENKKKQKKSVFNSSSTVFYCLVNKEKKIDTVVSFLNHFLLKRKICSVSLRLSLRNMQGVLIKEVIKNINKPIVYLFSILELLDDLSISKGEFSLYLEFTSASNLAVPFCAVTSEIVSQKTFDIVHTYGRALECSEFGSNIDFKTSYETGWALWNIGKNINNYLIFHNGRLHANTNFELSIYENGEKFLTLNPIQKKLSPFESTKIILEDELNKFNDQGECLQRIKDLKPGSIDIKIKITGIESTFPRLLFISQKNKLHNNEIITEQIDKINFTHSNFDFDLAIQPKSSSNYGFINNPKYPDGIKSGFRYYPCKDIENLKIDSEEDCFLPLIMKGQQSIRVSSSTSLSSRLVGSNWSLWNDSNFYKDCSTGTYIIEYVQNSGYWHWGRLIPKGKNISAFISLLNPFAKEDEQFSFTIQLFDEEGKCYENIIEFKGSEYYLHFSSKLEFVNSKNRGNWYAITGEGVGKFNIFSTCYFDDLTDGTIEHAF